MKTGLFFFSLVLLGAGCSVAFNLIGSTVDADGVLHEPFFLVPIGYLLVFSGLGGLAVLAAWRGGRHLARRWAARS